jgi:hypothetical protein
MEKEFKNCAKTKCKIEYKKVLKNNSLNDKKSTILFHSTDLTKMKEYINDIFSNKEQNELDLCIINKCNVSNDYFRKKINFLNNKIKVYNIQLTDELQKILNELISITSIYKLTKDIYIKGIKLYQLLYVYIFKKSIEANNRILDLDGKQFECILNKCEKLHNDVLYDNELQQIKRGIFHLKNNKKRDKVIDEYFSNKKRIELDKCIIEKCNEITLEFIKESIDLINKKIEIFELKIPRDIRISNIEKITEADIPDLIIKFNKLQRYMGKY